MARTISQYNLEAQTTPTGRNYLTVIVESVTQGENGVWGIATKLAEVASFPCTAPSNNPWGTYTRRAAERFMWQLEAA
jgi:hypothetical protein